MNRRSFLKYTAPVGAGAMMLGGMPTSVFASPSMMMLNCADVADRAMVIVNLKGGNDGLNTLIPLDQLSAYANARPTVGIPGATATANRLDSNLTGTSQDVGLHPVLMNTVKSMYDAGQCSIVNGVSYPQWNLSHFKSTDLMMTGGDGDPANFNFDTGWMGRFLQAYAPGAAGSSTTQYPDPLGLQLGDSKPSLGFYTYHTHQAAINLAGQDPNGFQNFVQEIGGAAINNVPTSEYGEELTHIMNIENSTAVYASRIGQVFNAGNNIGTYDNNYISWQLKTVARLISGGCKTKIFLVSVGGYDTHDNQVNLGSPTTGNHAQLLTELFGAIKTFHDDLSAQGLGHKVITTTFSEFGRKVPENGGRGTDHGTLAPVFIFGQNVKPGVYGDNPDLSNLGGWDNSLPQNMQADYRQVYATLLQDWLAGGDDIVQAAFTTGTFSKIPLIAPAAIPDIGCYVGSILPVDLEIFTAVQEENKRVNLEWVSRSELNFDRYEVERSADGREFEKLNEVPGKGSPDGDYAHYTDVDLEPLTGTSYYRLKMVDYDGSYRYSPVQSVFIEAPEIKNSGLYPNPAVYDVNVTVTARQDLRDAKISIVSMSGMIHRVQSVDLSEGFNKFNIDVSDLSVGNYFVRIESGNRMITRAMSLVVTR